MEVKIGSYPNQSMIEVPGRYQFEAAAGKIPGAETRSIFGVSINGALATTMLIWELNTDYTFQTSAQTLEILSDSANDAAAGTGARTVLVTTLDANYNEVQTVVTMNGTTPVALSGTHLFFNSALVLTFGSGNTNAGNITIRVASAGAAQGYIAAGASVSCAALFTVPAGKQFIIENFYTAAGVLGSAASGCRIYSYLRLQSGLMIRGLIQVQSLNGPINIQVPDCSPIDEKQSIMLKASDITAANCVISVGFTGILRNK